MSFDDASRPQNEEFDPLTSPLWNVDEAVDSVLAPPAPEFLATDEDTMIRRRPPQPPDVDEIIKGEYTGWVPLIKSGESLDEAKLREEARLSALAAQDDEWEPIDLVIVDESVDVVTSDELSNVVIPDDIASDSITEPRNPIVEVRGFTFPAEIVPDPDYVVSPAEALEEARRRIAQMRASLQTNLNRVSASFEHPIFTPEVSVQHAPPFIPKPEPVVISEPAPTQPVAAEPVVPADAFDDLFETELEEETTQTPFVAEAPIRENIIDDVQQVAARQEIREEPRVFTQSTQPSTTTVMIDEAAEQSHSLELVIMRDEIKDLRDRLDSSQKLIEQLMVRLADLAELALKRDR